MVIANKDDTTIIVTCMRLTTKKVGPSRPPSSEMRHASTKYMSSKCGIKVTKHTDVAWQLRNNSALKTWNLLAADSISARVDQGV